MGPFEPFGLTAGLSEILRHLPQMSGSRILGVVNAMAESWDLLFLRQHSFDVFHWIGTRAIDRFEDMEDSFVGSAVQWAFQATDGGDDGRVHVRKSGRRDSGGEGR